MTPCLAPLRQPHPDATTRILTPPVQDCDQARQDHRSCEWVGTHDVADEDAVHGVPIEPARPAGGVRGNPLSCWGGQAGEVDHQVGSRGGGGSPPVASTVMGPCNEFVVSGRGRGMGARWMRCKGDHVSLLRVVDVEWIAFNRLRLREY